MEDSRVFLSKKKGSRVLVKCLESLMVHRPVSSRLADLYDLVDDPSSDSIISWSENGKSFIVWKPEEFSREFLPKLQLSHDFLAFTRMLYRFGFRKVGYERWEFADEDFTRGKPELVQNMIHRKSAQARIDLKISKSQRRQNLEEEALELQSLPEGTMAIANQLESLQIASKARSDLLCFCRFE